MMEQRSTFLSVHHANLIIGFTHKTLSEKESDELDKWICESDENLEIFEELISRAVTYGKELDKLIEDTDYAIEVWIISGLIAREIEDRIEPDEKEKLDEWVNFSEENRRIYKSLSSPSNLVRFVMHVAMKYKNLQQV